MGRSGQAVARSAIRVAVAAAEPGVCSDGDPDAGAGDRREHGGLQRDERGAAAVAAGDRSGSPGVLEDFQPASRDRHHRFQRNVFLPGLRCAAAAKRRALAGDGLRAAVGQQGRGPLWSGAGRGGRRHGERHVLLRPGREAAARPRLQRAGRDEPCADCRDQLQLLDAAVCARPGCIGKDAVCEWRAHHDRGSCRGRL